MERIKAYLVEQNLDVYPTRHGLYVPDLRLNIDPAKQGYYLFSHFGTIEPIMIKKEKTVMEFLNNEIKLETKEVRHGLFRTP